MLEGWPPALQTGPHPQAMHPVKACCDFCWEGSGGGGRRGWHVGDDAVVVVMTCRGWWQ